MEEPIVEMTAVETLIHMLFVKKMFNELYYTHTEAEELREVFDFANNLFQKQITNAFNQGYTQCSIEDLKPTSRERFVDAEDYINKTFRLK